MTEIRCKKCNKLLGYIDGKYEIKCPRCGEMNVYAGIMQGLHEAIKYLNYDIKSKTQQLKIS